MNRARRALTTGLGAAVSTTVATALIASGTGLAAAAAPAEPAPSAAPAAERRLLDILKILDPAAILGALDGTATPGDLLGLQRPRWDNPLGLLTVTESVQWLRDGVADPGRHGRLLPARRRRRRAATSRPSSPARCSACSRSQSITGVVRILAPGTGGGGGGGSTTADLLEATPPQLTGIPGVGSLLQVLDPVWSLPGRDHELPVVLRRRRDPRRHRPDVRARPRAGRHHDPRPGHRSARRAAAGQPADRLPAHPGSARAEAGRDLAARRRPAPRRSAGPSASATRRGTPTRSQHAYQWLRDGAPIADATTAAYLLTPADLGRAITATVTGTKKGFTSATVDTEPVTPTVGDAIVASLQPRLSGTPALGQTLTASPGTWGTGETPTFGYQWLRDGSVLPSVTGATYVVTAADLGRALAVRVTATRTAYAPGVFTTSAVTVPKAATSTTAKATQEEDAAGQGGGAEDRRRRRRRSAPTARSRSTEGSRTLASVAIPQGRKTVRDQEAQARQAHLPGELRRLGDHRRLDRRRSG